MQSYNGFWKKSYINNTLIFPLTIQIYINFSIATRLIKGIVLRRHCIRGKGYDSLRNIYQIARAISCILYYIPLPSDCTHIKLYAITTKPQ